MRQLDNGTMQSFCLASLQASAKQAGLQIAAGQCQAASSPLLALRAGSTSCSSAGVAFSMCSSGRGPDHGSYLDNSGSNVPWDAWQRAAGSGIKMSAACWHHRLLVQNKPSALLQA